MGKNTIEKWRDWIVAIIAIAIIPSVKLIERNNQLETLEQARHIFTSRETHISDIKEIKDAASDSNRKIDKLDDKVDYITKQLTLLLATQRPRQ